jgi:hypothetical protein
MLWSAGKPDGSAVASVTVIVAPTPLLGVGKVIVPEYPLFPDSDAVNIIVLLEAGTTTGGTVGLAVAGLAVTGGRGVELVLPPHAAARPNAKSTSSIYIRRMRPPKLS